MFVGDIWQIAQGVKQKKEGLKAEAGGAAMDFVTGLKYDANTKQNQQAIESLTKQAEQERSNLLSKYAEFGRTGMSEEAKSLYSDMMSRNMSTAIGASRDRRGGLMGMGSLYQSTADSARELAAMDAEVQRQNYMQYLGYGERASEANISGRMMPLQYQIQRQEGLENRAFSKADAETDYGRAMYGAGQQNIVSGVQGIENSVMQTAGFLFGAGILGAGGAAAGGAAGGAASGGLYQGGLGQGNYGNQTFGASIGGAGGGFGSTTIPRKI